MGNSGQIDVEGVKERLECDDDFLVEIWGVFKDETVALPAQLAAAIEAGDFSSVGHQAHSLKGMSANIGAEKLQSVAYELEQSAKKGEIERINEIFPQLVETIKFVNVEIDELISKLSP